MTSLHATERLPSTSLAVSCRLRISDLKCRRRIRRSKFRFRFVAPEGKPGNRWSQFKSERPSSVGLARLSNREGRKPDSISVAPAEYGAFFRTKLSRAEVKLPAWHEGGSPPALFRGPP